ncbi:MAG: S1 RNA-binding domain-containing protein [Clostridiaceae bacterium]|nr:S1 RNA-binding domain-containing protein [Clostridiaceae bacterium]
MIELGKIQDLQVVRITSIGAYLNSKNNAENNDDILLPKKQMPQEIQEGEEIQVFVYRDSEDRMIATTEKPKITLGSLALLKVVDITKIGAFLDWGLEKDLFLPFKEQRGDIRKGREYVVGLYVDKSDRLCATMNIYDLLSSDAPYKEEDMVEGIIYNIHPTMGAFVAIDGKYHGLIGENHLYGDYSYGSSLEARVTKVKEDGKLDLSLRQKAYKQMDEDKDIIIEKIKNEGGILYLNDKSDPEDIKNVLNLSKAAFKRAVGRLMKEGKIKMTKEGIEILEK